MDDSELMELRRDKARLDWLQSLVVYWWLEWMEGRRQIYAPRLLRGQKSIARGAVRAVIDYAIKNGEDL
jgi:hypothetical protein